MNGMVTAGEEIVLRLTESRFFLNAQQYSFNTIKDADVTLFVNDELKETLQYKELIYTESSISRVLPPTENEYENPGVYVAEYLPKPGDHIRIEAKHPNYNVVEASLTLPVTPEILSLDTLDIKIREYPLIGYIHDPGSDYEGQLDTIGVVEMEQVNLKIVFKDPMTDRNYYRLGLYLMEKPESVNYFYERVVRLIEVKEIENLDSWTSDSFAINNSILNQNSPDLGSLIEDDDIMSSNPYLMFDDALFDGENYALNLIFLRRIGKRYFDGRIEVEDPNERIDEVILKFVLTGMTKVYRYFLQSFTANENYFPLFSEPVQIYNNVKGGIGIVGGETHAEIHIQIK